MPVDDEFGIAATKLRPPAPPTRLVGRTRLDVILDPGIDRHVPLVLVSAPAGSGKSTLLASWGPAPATWRGCRWRKPIPIRPGSGRRWSRRSGVRPDLASRLTPLVVGSKGDDRVIVPALVNELVDDNERLVVVIDDYHLIDSDSVHRGMERLVDLCPRELTLVLSTRIDPPFRLGRLRVRDQITEIRADDLRFATGEASVVVGAAARPVADPARRALRPHRGVGRRAGARRPLARTVH